MTEPTGIKHDSGKPDLSLNPSVASAEMAKAFGFGAWKYSPFNFEAGLEARRLLAAAKRHIDSVLNGEELDTEAYAHPTKGETRTSGAHHLGHAMASLAMYLRCRELGTLKDDRTPNRAKSRDVEQGPQPGKLAVVETIVGRTHFGVTVFDGNLRPGIWRNRAGSHTTIYPANDTGLYRAALTGFYYGSRLDDGRGAVDHLGAPLAAGAVWPDRPSEQDLLEWLAPAPRLEDPGYSAPRDESQLVRMAGIHATPGRRLPEAKL